MILTTRFACAFLLSLYKFPPLSFGLSLRREFRCMSFFPPRWNGTTAVSEARDTRSVGARGAATRHERVPPIDPSLHRLCFAGEGEERERESGQPILSLYRDLRARTHTSLLRKTFPILRVPRVYRVNERILSLQLFPPTCGKHFSSIFFSPFFFFFRTPDSRNIGFSPSDYSREFRQIYLDPRFGI